MLVPVVQETADVLASVPALLDLLHHMEGLSGSTTVGPLAESVLEAAAAAGSPDVADRIDAMRGATSARNRAAAMRQRQQMLAAIGLHQVRSFGSKN